MLTDELIKQDKFAIFGAQVIAIGAYTAIKDLTGRVPECFVVGKPLGKLNDGLYGNPTDIDGIEVRLLEDIPKDTFIVVGVTELVQKEVVPMLEKKGYSKLFVLTQSEEHLLMSAYFKSIDRFPLLSSVEVRDGAKEADNASSKNIDLTMYEVRNHRDNELLNRPSTSSYEISIQAGAALTDKRIAKVTDDTGDNISDKNRQYCEMTASYWVWKNTDHAWKGIEHYRRHLLIRPELLNMIKGDVDAILPLPYICYPDELYQFRRFVNEDVKNALLQGLKDVHPDEYEEYLKILQGPYQYTYNMVCAKREVFDDYCRWFFEITEHMEKKFSREVPELVETRAFSYIAEVLTNIYFMTQQNKLRILHVEKAIYT